MRPDDHLHNHSELAGGRRSSADAPEFADAEVIPVALTGGHAQSGTSKRTQQSVSKSVPEALLRETWLP